METTEKVQLKKGSFYHSWNPTEKPHHYVGRYLGHTKIKGRAWQLFEDAKGEIFATTDFSSFERATQGDIEDFFFGAGPVRVKGNTGGWMVYECPLCKQRFNGGQPGNGAGYQWGKASVEQQFNEHKCPNPKPSSRF